MNAESRYENILHAKRKEEAFDPFGEMTELDKISIGMDKGQEAFLKLTMLGMRKICGENRQRNHE